MKFEINFECNSLKKSLTKLIKTIKKFENKKIKKNCYTCKFKVYHPEGVMCKKNYWFLFPNGARKTNCIYWEEKVK